MHRAASDEPHRQGHYCPRKPGGYTHWAGLTDVTPGSYEPLAQLMVNPAKVRMDAPWQ